MSYQKCVPREQAGNIFSQNNFISSFGRKEEEVFSFFLLFFSANYFAIGLVFFPHSKHFLLL